MNIYLVHLLLFLWVLFIEIKNHIFFQAFVSDNALVVWTDKPGCVGHYRGVIPLRRTRDRIHYMYSASDTITVRVSQGNCQLQHFFCHFHGSVSYDFSCFRVSTRSVSLDANSADAASPSTA
jgi:hypothetical protein